MGFAFLPRTLSLNGASVRARLERWYRDNGRSFPWRRSAEHVQALAYRGEPLNDPYIVLVSEVMLQQTQASRVVTMLARFLALFPTVEALAAATRGDVLRAWQGLGYNNRAVRLHSTAAAVVRQHDGRFPETIEELRTLDGIGPYTAAAIACFAFGAQVPVVDVNIERLLSRLFFRCHTVDIVLPSTTITGLDAAVLPEGGAYWWHQALMDFGATICTARRPACDRCPLVDLCLSAFPRTMRLHGSGSPAEPTIASAPRRIWRGRIVEFLRGATGGLDVRRVIEALPGSSELSGPEREQILTVVEALVAEGMLVVANDAVRESGRLSERTIIRLPH